MQCIFLCTYKAHNNDWGIIRKIFEQTFNTVLWRFVNHQIILKIGVRNPHTSLLLYWYILFVISTALFLYTYTEHIHKWGIIRKIFKQAFDIAHWHFVNPQIISMNCNAKSLGYSTGIYYFLCQNHFFYVHKAHNNVRVVIQKIC